MQEENEAEEEVLDGVASVMAVALRRWGDAAMPYIEPLMPAVGQVHLVNDDARLASCRSSCQPGHTSPPAPAAAD